MKRFPNMLSPKIKQRIENNALPSRTEKSHLVDFSSSDYLGFSKSETILKQTSQVLLTQDRVQTGATGSRLFSGNHPLYQVTEDFIATFHEAGSALIFNSCSDANVGFFRSIPQQGDLIVYDELCHASLRDGIRLSNAKSLKFLHNDFEDLEEIILKHTAETASIYIVTESVFSMDGDAPNLEHLVAVSQRNHCRLVIDEAHALGVFGDKGQGLVQELKLQDQVFARIINFGNGLGCDGAVILGPQELKHDLNNFLHSFRKAVTLPAHSVATILTAYQNLESQNDEIEKLRDVISHLNQEKQQVGLKLIFVRSKSAIQSAILPGNENVKNIALKLEQNGFDIKAILSPAVPQGQERLRFCLHSFNSKEEVSKVLSILSNSLF